MSANYARSWQHTNPEQTPKKDQKVAVKVKKQGWITKGEKAIFSIVGAGLIAAGVFIVSFSSNTDALNRDIQKLEKTVQTQKVENEGLLYEMKELSRPERITKIAEKNGLKIQNAEVKQAHAFNN
ncbi:cell division protein FtsL [Virgibacillus halodenitrificans]|uniref:Cell division protein FtsL n=1 Tax=Virgibacillus halodenitrificans TaxID=1482 RepID=A0ABR7VS03_VIRHA|nr:cell division protein FtsL [Virgibacillus halodenitrificans]MBD1224625.1 cell division protein FtsL [Virgibacillus halodenitrificans]MCG1030183.1 cell division protein FtsL [Virgibacillus halodenitrificans]MCJ0931300.1 cell division protein FtsL [Virgibacillus halodenitrificans]MEC2160205.1 cell division protein FtsL [Virgibacillus halodenitrificans]MYL46556.1 cell division protein FtsL [Virgibacillus halodenitrificans]